MTEPTSGPALSGPVLSGMAAAAGRIPASLLMMLPALCFALGFDGTAYGLGVVAGVVLTAIVITPALARSGYGGSVSAYLARRFGAGAGALAALSVWLAAGLIITADLALTARIVGVVTSAAPAVVVGVVAALALALACLPPQRTEAYVSAALALVIGLGILAPLAILGWSAAGHLMPHLSYGEAMAEIGALETRMLEGGLADFKTMTPHAKPFIHSDALTTVALILSLAAGAACLPGIGRPGATPRGRRLSAAYTALFVTLAAISAPALAAYTKLEIYRALAQGTAVSALPAWLEAPSRAALVRVHGVSAGLLDDVTSAAAAGAADATAVSTYLAAAHPRSATAFAALKPQVKTALVDAGKTLLTASGTSAWEVLQQAVLPVAATASNNKTGLLTQGALEIEPEAIVMLAPALTPWPTLLTALFALSGLAAAIAAAAALAGEAANSLPDVVPKPAGAAALLLAASAAAIWVAPADPAGLAISGLSIAAAGLFPALVSGLLSRRVSPAAAVAAMALGLAAAIYYAAGTALFPASFYETWSSLSNATDLAARKFQSLTAAMASAADGAPKITAIAAREAYATRMGLANWFGIPGSCAALFALPLGFAALLLVSLARPSRKEGPFS